MNCLLPFAALCLFWGFTTGCNLQCTSEGLEWSSASVSGDKDRICSAGYSYRDCLGSDCTASDAVTEALKLQGCGKNRKIIPINSCCTRL